MMSHANSVPCATKICSLNSDVTAPSLIPGVDVMVTLYSTKQGALWELTSPLGKNGSERSKSKEDNMGRADCRMVGQGLEEAVKVGWKCALGEFHIMTSFS